MEKMIEQLYKYDDIYSTLNYFCNSLQSLQKGAEYRAEMARKFLKYGNVFVMKDDVGNLVGFTAFYDNDIKTKKAFLSMIAVGEQYKGKGFGKHLLLETEKKMLFDGMESVCLEVKKKNLSAISFYEKLGYSLLREEIRSLIYEKKL